MLGGDCRKFLNDELGGGTVMGLLWLMLPVGIAGMAADIINGFRIRTMLQATADADAVALGGAIDLPAAAAADRPTDGPLLHQRLAPFGSGIDTLAIGSSASGV